MFAYRNRAGTTSELASWVSEKLWGFVCFEFLVRSREFPLSMMENHFESGCHQKQLMLLSYKICPCHPGKLKWRMNWNTGEHNHDNKSCSWLMDNFDVQHFRSSKIFTSIKSLKFRLHFLGNAAHGVHSRLIWSRGGGGEVT